jgi:heme-degrading monooxygenase HmoA
MYAVIFKAEAKALDEKYYEMAQKMRKLALTKYGCTEFTTVANGSNEIAISYWNNLKNIKNWQQDSEHLAAQELGKSTWYKSYTVQVVEIMREYSEICN